MTGGGYMEFSPFFNFNFFFYDNQLPFLARGHLHILLGVGLYTRDRPPGGVDLGLLTINGLRTRGKQHGVWLFYGMGYLESFALGFGGLLHLGHQGETVASVFNSAVD